jgi:opacity protein-like surface antigen
MLTGKLSLMIVCAALCFAASAAFAQKNEIGLMLGATITPDREVRPQVSTGQPPTATARIGTGLTYGLSYARRIVDARVASLHGEVVFFAVPSNDVKSSLNFVPRNFASLFVTPGLKLKFLPQAPITPYVAAGGGFARFAESDFLGNNAPNTGKRGTNRGAFNYGGGLEFKVFPFVSLRGEVRHFITDNPQFNAVFVSDKQHSVISSAGVVLRF